jgi:enoyl-CoA hydratase/carnithine racemase
MTILQSWTEAACADLGVHADDDAIRTVLDLARDVAHQIERPAAPVSAFVLGLAVGGGQSLAEAAERLRTLAEGWPGSEPGDAGQ